MSQGAAWRCLANLAVRCEQCPCSGGGHGVTPHKRQYNLSPQTRTEQTYKKRSILTWSYWSAMVCCPASAPAHCYRQVNRGWSSHVSRGGYFLLLITGWNAESVRRVILITLVSVDQWCEHNNQLSSDLLVVCEDKDILDHSWHMSS